MGVPVKFPEIRHFPQSGKFQSMPRFGGLTHYGPEFVTQSEAAYFNLALYRALNLSEPAYADAVLREIGTDKDADKRAAVERKAREFMQTHRLQPQAVEEKPAPQQPQQQQPQQTKPEPATASSGQQQQRQGGRK